MRKIQWKKGNGSMLLGALICALGIFLMAGVAESINLFQASVYAQTRADLIADGSASYGMSYDNTLDEGKVSLMSSLLLASSADFDNPISMRLNHQAIADNKVHVQVTTEREFWFPRSGQESTFQVTKEAVTQVISP